MPRRDKKQHNKENSTQLLKHRGIKFESKNDGTHLVVTHNGYVADLWPSTGKYNIRGTSEYGRGVFNLLDDIKSKKETTEDKLRAVGLDIESKNNGIHLIVRYLDAVVDFWPMTGKYKFRNYAETNSVVEKIILGIAE